MKKSGKAKTAIELLVKRNMNNKPDKVRKTQLINL